MNWDMPYAVDIDGKSYAIRNKCDYRVVLDVIDALNDKKLEMFQRLYCALYIFYEDLSGCKNIKSAVDEMMSVISLGQKSDAESTPKPKVMDWKKDWDLIAPAISRVLGYEVRDPDKYTHWYSLIGTYAEMGECTFTFIVSLRLKKINHEKFEPYEKKFYTENYERVNITPEFTEEEEAFFAQLLA